MLGWVAHLMSEGSKERCDGSRAMRRRGRRGWVREEEEG